MADKRKEESSEEDIVIKMIDEDGNIFYFLEEMIIPVDGENFAFLIELHKDHDEHCDCEDDAIIAKIVLNDKGQEEYIEPTDEEFEKVRAIYEKILDEEE